MPAANPTMVAQYEARIRQALQELGLPESLATARRNSLQVECDDLVSIGHDLAGRPAQLARNAAAAWAAMSVAARHDGVSLGVVSAFRSFEYQKGIIARKLAAGQTVERILAASALPGFSEHHTGRAVDIGTPGCPPLTEAFERTEAYAWLSRRAEDFGALRSYPRGNPHGVIFEPWHWVFTAP